MNGKFLVAKKKKIILLKSIYYLFPKFLRDQYKDSIDFYKDLANKIKMKNSISFLKERREALFLILTENTNELNVNIQLLYSELNRKSKINGPKLFTHNAKYIQLEKLENPVLDSKVFLINNIAVLGMTDALISHGVIYHQELNNMEEKHDLKRDDIFIERFPEVNGVLTLTQSQSVLNHSDTIYVSLLKEHSTNYYHWITENIPRLILSNILINTSNHRDIFINQNIILLIDDEMPQQCLEIVRLVTNERFKIHSVKRGELIRCQTLLYCSPFWQSLDNTKGILNINEFFVDKYALSLVREEINKKIPLTQKEPFRKIYLRRRVSQMRSIINNNQVEAFMTTHGFEIIETDTISFSEQVKLFSEAKIVVGASGATFTNILFMQPKTIAIVFFPSHSSINHYMFQPLADVSNIQLVHFKTISKFKSSIHDNFLVDLKNLSILLGDVLNDD
ncbi:glycosyltransferase family 61 protein [Sulfuricurvum sp.]|uniref:glycosyltransferase family 61 protein n=1 Tax=Sulfuricurvum sp. TaxID=2025608 RepID=UPI003BB13D49